MFTLLFAVLGALFLQLSSILKGERVLRPIPERAKGRMISSLFLRNLK